jgi:type I restriction-modification system DNA methylase subunit
MGVPGSLVELVECFHRNIDLYKSGSINETELRRQFLDPFFTILGWDVENKSGYADAYKDVVHEYSLKTKDVREAPDYCFRIGGTRKFFVEAKKPGVNVKDDIHPAFQVRSYAWSAKLPLSILTDFEEFAVYDCRIPPKKTDKASVGRIMFLTYDQYSDKWNEIQEIFARESVLKGSFDKYAESNKKKKGTAEVDEVFLLQMEEWRKSLAGNIALRNPNLNIRELNYAVQKTIDRIVFLRICEDRGIEDYGQLMNLLNGANVYNRLKQIFHRADEKYNSGLFHFEKEKGRIELPDVLTPNLLIDDKAIKEIIKELYYPESPYEFSVLPADILGQVYEQFLGKIIRLTPGHHAVVDDKPEVKKAGGVYYTPTYIVDYIVNNTVGRLLSPAEADTRLKFKTPKQVNELKIVDPACGSGSFLLAAYQYLLDWHLKNYIKEIEKDSSLLNKRNSPVYLNDKGVLLLTTSEKKRILLNNIFGVDIDSQAVEVTKLSLMLKVLEGESAQTLNNEMQFFRQRALPDLSNNIKCGNSLIGPDFYDQMEITFLNDEEKLKINVFDWNREFKEIMDAGGFDVVIGNPPYVRQELLGAFKNYFGQKYKVYHGVADLYSYFIEKGVTLLNKGGYFSYIVANKWMRANYGEPLRTWMQQQNLIEIIDFGDLPVFKGATTYPCILLIANSKSADELNATEIKSLSFDNLKNIVDKALFTVNRRDLQSSGWNLVSSDTSLILSKIFKKGIPLGEYVNNKIFRGVLTGLNKAFVIDEETRDKLITEDPKSTEIIKPFLTGRDIKRYAPLKTDKFIIFTRRGIDIDLYPAVKKYLLQFKSELMPKPKNWSKEWRGRKPGNYQWYEIQDAVDYFEEFGKVKIIYPNICSRNEFTYDNNNYYTNQKCFIIARDDKYLLAVLNSRVFHFLYEMKLPKLRGGFYEPSYVFLKDFPIPEAPQETQNDLALLADEMLRLKKTIKEAKTSVEVNALERHLITVDEKIDKIVGELYRLDENDIKHL